MALSPVQIRQRQSGGKGGLFGKLAGGVAGAVAGGGLTIIANAPNPAAVSILKKYFKNGISPAGILAGSLVPTVIAFLIFLIFR